MMIDTKKPNRSVILACLCCCLLFAFLFDLSLLWDIKRTIDDDAWNSLANPIEFALGTAKHQGRFQFLIGAWLWTTALNLDQSQLYNYLHYGSLVVAHGLFFATIGLYLGWAASIWTALVYISSLMIYWEHSLLTAMPLWHFASISAGLLALIFLRFTRLEKRWHAVFCSVLLLFAFLGHEYQPFIFALAFLVCWGSVTGPVSLRTFIVSRGSVLSLGALSIFLTVYFVFRKAHPSIYAGNNIGEFSTLLFFKTLFHFSLSSSSFYQMLFSSYVLPLFDPQPGHFTLLKTFPIVSKLFSIVSLADWSKALFIGLGFMLFMGTLNPGTRFSRHQKVFATVTALFVMLFPNFLLAITQKYQHSFRAGIRIYSYTSISHFGMALLAGIWLSALYAHLQNRSARILISALTGFVLIIASAFSFSHNRTVGETLRRNEARWIFQKLISFENLQGQPAYVVAPRLWQSYGFGFPTNADEYWETYAKQKFGKNIKFLLGLEQVPVGKTFYFADFSYLSECGANLIWNSQPIVKKENMTFSSVRLSEIQVRSAERLRHVFVNYINSENRPRSFVIHERSISSAAGMTVMLDGLANPASILLSCWPLVVNHP